MQLLEVPNDMGGHALVPVAQQDSAPRGSAGGSASLMGFQCLCLSISVSGCICGGLSLPGCTCHPWEPHLGLQVEVGVTWGLHSGPGGPSLPGSLVQTCVDSLNLYNKEPHFPRGGESMPISSGEPEGS